MFVIILHLHFINNTTYILVCGTKGGGGGEYLVIAVHW